MRNRLAFVAAAALLGTLVAQPAYAQGARTVTIPLVPDSERGCVRAGVQGVPSGCLLAAGPASGSLQAECTGTITYTFGDPFAVVYVDGWASDPGATWIYVKCTVYQGVTHINDYEWGALGSHVSGSGSFLVPVSQVPDRLCTEAGSSLSPPVSFIC